LAALVILLVGAWDGRRVMAWGSNHIANGAAARSARTSRSCAWNGSRTAWLSCTQTVGVARRDQCRLPSAFFGRSWVLFSGYV